ncbi:hypothetical protein AAFP30_28520 [Gordonia sp. CPCC 205515]|uniref:ApeA N-terminal domain 1-containing protein n=1 Tax=Gordonia sp. CPCC 205515 TaxID=3140791 RepID=UPI003AF3E1C0
MTDEPNHVDVAGSIPPGEYPCIWSVDGRDVSGSIDLRGNGAPVGTARVVLDPNVTRLPYERTYAVLRGFIEDQNAYVALTEVAAVTWFGGQALLHAAAAIVGRGQPLPDDLRFDQMTAQVTNLDYFSGVAPLSNQEIPTSEGSHRRWGATATELSREWLGTRGSATFCYSYKSTIDPFLLSVRFAPWLVIKSSEPLDVRVWHEQWCYPLVQLIAASTGKPEKLTHMRVGRLDGTEYTVYAKPITQQPYNAVKQSRLLLAFTADDRQFSLASALEKWGDLHDDGHPLMLGYNAFALAPDQNPRGRLLLLLQLLEASYGFENRDQVEIDQIAHGEDRAALIEKLRAMRDEQILTSREFLLAKSMPKVVYPTLERALRHYLNEHSNLSTEIHLAEIPAVAALISANGASSTIDALRVIRNGLSHGTVNYSDDDLRELTKYLHPVARAEFLRLLGATFEPKSLDWWQWA